MIRFDPQQKLLTPPLPSLSPSLYLSTSLSLSILSLHPSPSLFLLPPLSPSLSLLSISLLVQGMKLCGETVLRITGAGPHSISWVGYGFHLNIPHGAVPEDVTVSVAVKAFLPVAGKLNLPKNIRLVSAIYEMSSSEVFHKDVSVHIQHYNAISSVEEATCYRFIKGRHSHKDASYSFEILEGNFSTHSQLATISMKQFCSLTVVSNTSCPVKNCQYAGHAYHRYNPDQPTSLDLVFLLTPNLEVYEKVL